MADNATSQLSEHGKTQKANHQRVLDDLMDIRNRAADVWQKIGSLIHSLSCLLSVHLWGEVTEPANNCDGGSELVAFYPGSEEWRI